MNQAERRMLSFRLSEEQEAIRDLARRFAEKEIKPVALQFEQDSEGKLAERIIDRAAEVGLGVGSVSKGNTLLPFVTIPLS